MKQGTIIKAYPTVCKLYDQPLTLAAAYRVYKLKSEMEKAWAFQAEQERKLIDEYKPTEAQGTTLKFADEETAAKFRDKMQELFDTESEFPISPISIPLSEQISITAAEIPLLEGIVQFVE